ncbi:RNA-binding domain-containing protein [Bathymodiolus septemdierum thioautotrophic gill symbiont]|uniref:ATP-dependent DNA helicase RecG n=1 Tax=endosymbiont of Bathymodiolus septemdierum str. Myojin knoll TaxID=1303921 RepID=A0A0P0UPW9_9GAMM|nr:RNA-binding domain-containing protein [Bathymodiolus septemdierum thioautotrophic gill symbiont]BAS67049.1 ATP-dependent DNA helicase RecG [endosymbiont of Bathymodiolus septemdierum str. Myojin knoll]
MIDVLKRLLTESIETEVLEFKTARQSFDKHTLGKYFSALSNEASLSNKSYAWLIFGVNDDHDIVGTQITEQTLNKYKLEIKSNTSPMLNFTNIHRVDVEGKQVLMFQIPSALKGVPTAWKGHYYGRDGESLGALNMEELERIKRQNIAFDWSAKTVDNAEIKDLSTEAIALAREQFLIKNPNLVTEINSWDDTKFLNKAKITINGKITTTAILLLGKPESEHFINPAVAKISWILKDRDNLEKDYEHFGCPLLANIDNVYAKIRNLKYRYLPEETLFPEETNQFDPYIIREALNNCIVHQDYTLGGKINVVEREDGVLTFVNSGGFIPESIEKVLEVDAPETCYRNPFLASAMVNLGMIDTIGSGIKKMFILQKDKFFPLPIYNLGDDQVKVEIIGKVLDMNYARRLAQSKNDLTLQEIVLLDKVAKRLPLLGTEIKALRRKGLIEGRKPNFHISSSIAASTGGKSTYIKLKGIDNDYCQKMILDFLKKFESGRRQDFEEMLLDKLPDALNKQQKRNKVRNNLQSLKKQKLIEPHGKLWKMSKPKN